ncbi:very short patch repair endonuclease [Geomonas subterranea]|uniref:very short patch repair endonuclease n=1 Tax=Geomonas subterranea TaxID=2847989 RepID=UPI00296E8D22|nr:very short patch repair endonuclease [Geomonas fuzhouensis]
MCRLDLRMVDRISLERRSWNMSRIRSKNTKPEVRVRSLLHRMGYRFRIHSRNLPGTPDIVLPRYKKVVFVHGCFWHRHPGCIEASRPKTNSAFWEEKISRNLLRDRRHVDSLEKLGWTVVVIWECDVKGTDETLSSFLKDAIFNGIPTK